MDPLWLVLILLAVLGVSVLARAVAVRRSRLSVPVSQEELDAQTRRVADAQTKTYMDILDLKKRGGGLPG
jgi:hypothetical protein